MKLNLQIGNEGKLQQPVNVLVSGRIVGQFWFESAKLSNTIKLSKSWLPNDWKLDAT